MQYVKAISETIERLSHIGVAIRLSPRKDDVIKVRDFTGTLDSTFFSELAYLALKNMFAQASEELLELLTSSMVKTYRKFLRGKSQHEERGTLRPQPQKQMAMNTIPEGSAADEEVGQHMDLDAQNINLSTKTPHSPLPPRQAHQRPTSSKFTSIDSKLFEANMRKHGQRATTSIAIDQASYARPAKERKNCQWCFEPLPDDRFEGEKWL
jgi:hypothetical protein